MTGKIWLVVVHRVSDKGGDVLSAGYVVWSTKMSRLLYGLNLKSMLVCG